MTVVCRSPLDANTPYVVSRVRLLEDVVMLTRLEGQDPHSWSIGARVQVAWKGLEDGRSLPVFVSEAPSAMCSPLAERPSVEGEPTIERIPGGLRLQ